MSEHTQLELFQKIGEDLFKSNHRKEAAEKAEAAIKYFEQVGLFSTEDIKVVRGE